MISMRRMDGAIGSLAIIFSLLAGETLSFGAHRKDANPVLKSENYLFYDTEYVFYYSRVTWDEAIAICPSINGHLATVDNIEKARFLSQTMSDLDIRIEDIWVGARQVTPSNWIWVETGNPIALKQDENGYPPWLYTPGRSGKDCLAMDRKGHDEPIFVDVTCKQPRPYICERSLGEDNGEPKAARTVRYGDSFYTLYHGRLSWNDAIAYCRTFGKHLAIVNSDNIASVLSQAMTKSRPDFESVWIGGRYLYGDWRWAPSGELIPAKMDPQDKYPPWRANSSRTHKQCILFDRHLCDEAVFIDTKCQRTRDFICEEAHRRKEIVENPRFSFNGLTFELDPHNFTWDESSEACKDKGGHLVDIPDSNMLEFVTDLMSETGSEISHVWVGGILQGKKWMWQGSGQEISFPSDDSDFPPWCDNDTRIDMPCLNLDRADHSRPMFYGLECNNTQPFVCQVDCMDPEEVENGTWHCTEPLRPTSRICQMLCNEGFMTFGSPSVHCSLKGWQSERQLSVAPQCVTLGGLSDILIDKLRMTISKEKVRSILFIIEDCGDESDKQVGAMMEIASAIVQVFPLGPDFKAGVLVFGSTVMEYISMNEQDSCNIVRATSGVLDRRVGGIPNYELALRAANEQILKYGKNQKTIIVLMGNQTQRGGSYAVAYNELYSAGHMFFVLDFGTWLSEYYPNALINLASKGPDETLNYFYFNNSESLLTSFPVVIMNQSRSSEIDCSSFWKDNVSEDDEDDTQNQRPSNFPTDDDIIPDDRLKGPFDEFNGMKGGNVQGGFRRLNEEEPAANPEVNIPSNNLTLPLLKDTSNLEEDKPIIPFSANSSIEQSTPILSTTIEDQEHAASNSV